MAPRCSTHYPFLEIKQTEIFDDQPQRVQRSVTELFIVDLRHLLRIFSFVLFYSSRWCYLLGTQPKEHPYIFVTKVLYLAFQHSRILKINVYTLCTVGILVGYFDSHQAGNLAHLKT